MDFRFADQGSHKPEFLLRASPFRSIQGARYFNAATTFCTFWRIISM